MGLKFEPASEPLHNLIPTTEYQARAAEEQRQEILREASYNLIPNTEYRGTSLIRNRPPLPRTTRHIPTVGS